MGAVTSSQSVLKRTFDVFRYFIFFPRDYFLRYFYGDSRDFHASGTLVVDKQKIRAGLWRWSWLRAERVRGIREIRDGIADDPIYLTAIEHESDIGGAGAAHVCAYSIRVRAVRIMYELWRVWARASVWSRTSSVVLDVCFVQFRGVRAR